MPPSRKDIYPDVISIGYRRATLTIMYLLPRQRVRAQLVNMKRKEKMVHLYKIQTLEFGKSWVAIVWRKEGEEGEKKRKQTRRGDIVRGSRSKTMGERERTRK